MKTELSIGSATRRATLGVVLAMPLALVALAASAAPVLDGMRDAVYGLRSVQTVQTQFGVPTRMAAPNWMPPMRTSKAARFT